MSKTTLKLFSGGFPDALKPEWLRSRAAGANNPPPAAEVSVGAPVAATAGEPKVASPAAAGDPTSPSGLIDPNLKPGQVVAAGRFRVEQLLDDTGSMAFVYRATQLSLGRVVVLKVLRMRFGGRESERERLRARLEKELRAYGKLNHPNIVTVHDSGWTEDGHPWIAMEFLEGRSLRSDMRKTRLYSQEEMLAVIAPVARALAAAHEGGIVHNDVKPENIYLLKDGTVKLVDFGTAKFFAEIDKSSGHNLGVDTVIGTPAYMPAERHYVQPSENDDPRSDLYSLGIVEVEMLTGVNPITNNDRGLSRKQIAARHATAKFQKPVAATTELWAVIEPLLRVDPDRRTSTARQHAEHLARITEQQKGPWLLQQGSAQPQSPAASSRSELKLLRSLRSAGLGAVFGTLVAASGYSMLWLQARHSEHPAPVEETRPSTLQAILPKPQAPADQAFVPRHEASAEAQTTSTSMSSSPSPVPVVKRTAATVAARPKASPAPAAAPLPTKLQPLRVRSGLEEPPAKRPTNGRSLEISEDSPYVRGTP